MGLLGLMGLFFTQETHETYVMNDHQQVPKEAIKHKLHS